MIRLQPHTEYELTYHDGSKVHFQTLSDVPEAKHLIKVEIVATGDVVDFITLLEQRWIDIKEIGQDAGR